MLGTTVQPNDLVLVEHIELVVVPGMAIDFADVPNMWLSCSEGVRKAWIKVRGEDSTDQAAHDKVGQNPVAGTNCVARTHQIEDHALSKVGREKQVLDNKREVLRKAVCSAREPWKPLEPGLPF